MQACVVPTFEGEKEEAYSVKRTEENWPVRQEENLEDTVSPNPRKERKYVKEEAGIKVLKLGLIVDHSIWH